MKIRAGFIIDYDDVSMKEAGEIEETIQVEIENQVEETISIPAETQIEVPGTATATGTRLVS